MKRPNRAFLHAEYVKIEHKIEAARAARDHADKIGDRRGVERQARKIDGLDQTLSQLHAILFPIAMGSPYDPPPPGPACDYCGLQMTDEESFASPGLCDRCNPEKPGLPPTHPLWSPLVDGQANNRR